MILRGRKGFKQWKFGNAKFPGNSRGQGVGRGHIVVNCLSEVNGPKAVVTPTEETQGSGETSMLHYRNDICFLSLFFLYSTNNYVKFKAIKGKYLMY